MEICAYARHNPETFLLVGNHDYDCHPFTRWQPQPWERCEQENRNALMANIDLLQPLCMGNDNVIFSHGGLTPTFMDENSLASPEDVNKLWIYHPEAFDFRERDPATGQWSNRYGDDPWQSTIWARNEALKSDGAKGYNHVVGHTSVDEPAGLVTDYGDKILFTCTLDDTLIRVGG